jgi:hypothetical protein
MISTIIFSKNRACQLELLLRSIKTNLPLLYKNINILYTYTNNNFQNGYKYVSNKYPEVNFILEKSFEQDTRNIIKNSEYILLLADDNIVYRKSNISSQLIVQHMINTNSCCFSLRLGLNTVVQNPYIENSFVVFPHFFDAYQYNEIKILTWSWKTCPKFTNFGYPFACDGHIYNKEVMLNNLDFDFHNTTELEGRYCHRIESFVENMSCLEYSVVVNTPNNTISPSGLTSGQKYDYTLEYLNNMLLNGYIVNLEEVMNNNIIGCHQELELSFTNDSI